MDIISYINPQLDDENKKLIQLMIRNPLYMKENNVGLNISQKWYLVTFLNNAPIIQLGLTYPLYFTGLTIYGLTKSKHKQWARYTFFKTFLYPFYVYSLYFLTVRCFQTNKVIEYTFSRQKELAKQNNAFQNYLLFDKVQQLNFLLSKGDFQQLEKSENRIKNVIGFSGVKKNVFEKLSKIDAEVHIQVRQMNKFQGDEDDPNIIKTREQVNDFINKIYI